MIQDQPKIDWVNLPSNTAAQSLWAPLHDGELLSVCSNALERTITLEVDVAHLRDFYKLGELAHFVITAHGIESARASTITIWPGAAPEFEGKPYEEQSRLMKEFKAKWCEESVGWKDFLAAFPSNTLHIYDAEIAQDENHMTLQVQGTLDGNDFDNEYFWLFIRSQKIELKQSDGDLLPLEQLVKLGEDYWEAWGTRR